VDTEDETIQSYFTLLEWLINRNFPQRRITSHYAVPFGQFLAFAAHVEPLVLPKLIPQGQHTFRTYSSEDRAKLLLMTSTLLDPWPTQLIQLQKNSYFGFEDIPWQAWSRPEYFRQPEASRPFGLEKNQFGSSLAHYILHSSGPRIVKDWSKQWEHLRWTRDPIDLSQSANQTQKQLSKKLD
jgi:hypothetical protein